MDYINNLIISKLNEIQSRLPISINLISKNSNISFKEVLDELYPEKSISTNDINHTSKADNNRNTAIKNKSALMEEINKYVIQASQKYGVDSNLINAIIKAESDYNPNSVSKAGAVGLMQLMPSTADFLSINNPFDIEQNIDGGVRYLKTLITKYNDLPKAIAAYNAGPAAVDKYNGIPPYNETIDYVGKILNALNIQR